MSTFGELYRLFQKEVMELCLLECFHERRPVFYVDEYEEFNDPCYFCPRQRLFVDLAYDERFTPPNPNNFRSQTCGGQQCQEFWEFFNGKTGRDRQKRFRKLWRSDPWDMPAEIQTEAILTFMINHEAKNVRLRESA